MFKKLFRIFHSDTVPFEYRLVMECAGVELGVPASERDIRKRSRVDKERWRLRWVPTGVPIARNTFRKTETGNRSRLEAKALCRRRRRGRTIGRNVQSLELVLEKVAGQNHPRGSGSVMQNDQNSYIIADSAETKLGLSILYVGIKSLNLGEFSGDLIESNGINSQKRFWGKKSY